MCPRTEGSGPAESATQVCSHTFMCCPEGREAAERVRELFKNSCLPKELLRPQKLDILKSFLVQGASCSCSHPSACAQLCGFMEQHSNSAWVSVSNLCHCLVSKGGKSSHTHKWSWTNRRQLRNHCALLQSKKIAALLKNVLKITHPCFILMGI